tara:strand:- start:1768 stop:1971 length:204 start_codon:yes stop_codon:yes gene_type:complete
MKLYDTDYLLKDKDNNFLKFDNEDYIIYSESAKDEEVIHDGDEWVKTTELPASMQKKLIEQLTKEEK